MSTTQMTVAKEFVRSLDPREMPRYTISEAARYLRVPGSTLRAWFTGTTYGSRPFLKLFRPILKPVSPDLLSFYDVASAHVLVALKNKGASTENIRAVVESLVHEFPEASYPLLGHDFLMFGKSVMIRKIGLLMNLSKFRQLGMHAIIDRYLSRVDLDKEKMPLRFSPVHTQHSRGKGLIVIDPNLSSGRPVIRGTGIAAEVIARRRQSGESVSSLAKDYRIARRAVEEAVRYFDKEAA